MSLPTFARFLSLANQYRALLVDLAAEDTLLSHAQLLNYLDGHGVHPGEKNNLIDSLCQASILVVESEQSYTINPVVADLVNYYERRGWLTNADFLRDQILAIAQLTDDLQRQLFAEEVSLTTLTDLVDSLYRLVREVRQSGEAHYLACMRLFGDLKRQSENLPLNQRLQELETIHRRHVKPLEELIDPTGEYAHKIQTLRRRIVDLSQRPGLLAQSQELTGRRQRLLIDLEYIDHVILRHFITVADTTRSLIKSFLEEKSIKTALATCLGRLDDVWMSLNDHTIVAPQRRTFGMADQESLAQFFADIIQRKHLPHPTPLHNPEVQKQIASDILITPDTIWKSIQITGTIPSWPQHVLSRFAHYSEREQLKAIALPLTTEHPQVAIRHLQHSFQHTFVTFQLQMPDFSITWSQV